VNASPSRSLFVNLAVAALALASCNIPQLGDGQTSQSTSPGTVTLRLDLPDTRTFCDQLATCAFSTTHITIATVAGQVLQLSPGFCPTLCGAQCQPQLCPAIACPIGGGQAVTQVSLIWDGSYYESGTCGSGTSCVSKRFVLPGRYVANMCATPGTLSQGDAGPTATCTATGQQECIAVTFELPGPPTIERALPDVAPAMRTDSL